MHRSEQRAHCPMSGSTGTPTTTGQAGYLFCSSVPLTMDLAFQELLEHLYTSNPQMGASQVVLTWLLHACV